MPEEAWICDVLEVDAQGDADDRFGDQEALKKEVFLPEFGRLAGQKRQDQKGQKAGIYGDG